MFSCIRILPDINVERQRFFFNYYFENEYTKPDSQYMLLVQIKFLL